MSDRIGRRPVILIGLGGCVAALLAFGLVEELWLAYLTRALGGAVVSAVLPVAPDNRHLQAIPLDSLLLLALLGMFGLGSFEVSIALQGQQTLNLDPFQIGMLFLGCSLMMVIVQVLLFTSLVRYFSFTQIIVYALLIMAAGLGLFPISASIELVILAVGLVGLGPGVLIPILAYQASLNAGTFQGAALGRQTAAGSLGQGLGSVLVGGLFGVVSQAPFWLTAGLLTVGAFFGHRLGEKQPDSH